MLFVSLLIVTLATRSVAYPNGAPTSVCGSMTPSHGASAQNSASAIRISTVDSQCYTNDQPLSLQISGSLFRGFLVEAISAGSVVGTFTAQSSLSKTINCGSGTLNALTHTNENTKSNVKFIWNAPANPPNQITFRLTVVKDYTTFWLAVDTTVSACQVVSSTSTTTSPSTTTTSRSTTTTTTTSPSTTTTSRSTTTTTTTTSPSTTTISRSTTTRTTTSPSTTTKSQSTSKKSSVSPSTSQQPGTSTCSRPVDSRICRKIKNYKCYEAYYRYFCCQTCNRYFAIYGKNPNCAYGDKCDDCSRRKCWKNQQSSYALKCCYTCAAQLPIAA